MIGCFYHRLPAQGRFQVFSATDDTRSNWAPTFSTARHRWRC